MIKVTLAVLAVLALGVSLAQAAAITVPNYSFEDTSNLYGPVGWGYGSTGGGYPYVSNNSDRVMPTDGSYFCDTQVPGNGGIATMTSGWLAVAVAGNTYTLTAQIGNDNFEINGVLAQVAILLDNSPIATSFVYDTTLGAEGVLVDLSLSYMAVADDAGKDITVQLIATDPGTTGGTQAQWDNVRLFEETPPPVPGDTDLNGTVDLDDFSVLENHFESGPGKTWAEGDFTGDGEVKLDDFVLLKDNFTVGAAVPEPATLTLLGLSTVMLRLRKKR